MKEGSIEHFKLRSFSDRSWMFNLQRINELIFCLETGKWSSLEEIVQKFSHPESKLNTSLNLKQNEPIQMADEKNIVRINLRTKGLINRLNEIQSQEKSNKIKKKNCKDNPVIWNSLSKVQINDAIVNFTAVSTIIIIGFYLVACSIAPLVNLNSQTFRVIFTIAGGIPSILFYSKSQANDKQLDKKMTEFGFGS